MTTTDFINTMREFLEKDISFFFLIDFEKQKPVIFPINQAAQNNIYFEVENLKNHDFLPDNPKKEIAFKAYPVDFKIYSQSFEIVQKNLLHGNTYLLNLTFPTRIETNYTLKDIFRNVKAKYKLLFKDDFTLFSPEPFIKIKDNKIFTYPMKGTIDATIPNAASIILNNKKELYEHYTVVDLLRNDLAIVAEKIEVKRFRYLEKISTHKGEILQVSSEIQGYLPENWKKNFPEKLWQMLPAGSISGAPKQKTVEIIQQAEINPRGYYTGIFGIYTSDEFISAVNIRYVEKKDNELFFRSGGGITAFSNVNDEYQELIQKVYVPIR